MYIQRMVISGKTIEFEKHHTFRYRSKRRTRQPNQKPTSEAMAKINAKRAQRKLTRLINNNFKAGDYSLSLTYTSDNRALTAEAAEDDLKKFLRNLRLRLKRLGIVLKYIAVTEHGKRSLHHHVVINGEVPVELVNKCWSFGRVHITPLDDMGNYERLAAYLLKETSKNYNNKELSTCKWRWRSSRNLVQPIEKVSRSTADSWREVPVAPKGYYVLKDSVESGIDGNGYPFQYYKCLSLDVSDMGKERVLFAAARIAKSRKDIKTSRRKKVRS